MYQHRSPRLRRSGAAFAFLTLSSVSALSHAACSPASPTDGASVTCSGTSTGISDSHLDGATITVDNTGRIDGGSDRALRFGNNVTLTNAGILTSSGDHAVQGRDGAYILNTGSISSTDNDGIHVNNDSTVINRGSISAEGDGIQVDDDSQVVNEGSISSIDNGIDGGDGATITNTGTGTILSEAGDGININANGTVVNSGTITAAEDGIQTGENSSIRNEGRVTATNNGINADDDNVTVINTGTIISTSPTGTDGSDDVYGVVVDDTSSVTNSGTITSTGTSIHAGDSATITNSGTITSSLKDGINANENSIVTNTGTISAADDGIQVDDGSQVVNEGSISATDNGIDGGDRVTVTNTGTITSETGDGINVNDNSTVVNSGTIIAQDDGIQTGINGRVTNSGTIISQDEGINANENNAVVTNTGTIIAADDGINVAENAYVVNTGTITVTGDQDGIDIDSGTVINSGTITALGSEDGIDFDPSSNSSTVINSGTISGWHGIYHDPSDNSPKTITNSGTITGRSGTAISLGGGDDTLIILHGSTINGLVELGGGSDTVDVRTRSAQTLSFGSDPETILTIGPSVYGDSTLVIIDPAPLSAGDWMIRDLAYDLGHNVLEAPEHDGLWVKAFGGHADLDAENDPGFSNDRAGVIAGYDVDMASGLSLGGYLTYSHSRADFDDDLHEATQESYLAGVRGQWTFSPAGRIGATLFGGRTSTELSSPDTATGDGTADGTLWGLALRGSYTLLPATSIPGLDIAAEAGWMHHDIDSYHVSGLANGKISDRTVESTWGRVELGAPVVIRTTQIRPFIAATFFDDDSDDIDFSAVGSSTSFSPTDWSEDNVTTIGVSLSSDIGAGNLDLRGEIGDDVGYLALTYHLPF